eukprot:4433604-Pyramimonas_sp.AAC.1
MVGRIGCLCFLVPVVQRTLPHACHSQHHFCPSGRGPPGEVLCRPAKPAVRSAVGIAMPCRRSALAVHT